MNPREEAFLKRKGGGTGEEKRKTPLQHGTGEWDRGCSILCEMLLFSRAGGSEMVCSPSPLEKGASGRMRLQSEVCLLPPCSGKHQPRAQQMKRATEL